jgi:hypothetical protein
MGENCNKNQRRYKSCSCTMYTLQVPCLITVIPAQYYESVDSVRSLSFSLTVGFSETNCVNSRYTAGVTILVLGTVGA